MCLGVPGQIVSITGNIATVDFWGICKDVRLDVLKESIAPGDYILNHAGFAVRRIDDALAAETVALYAMILCDAGDDPVARNIFDDVNDAALV